MYSYHCLDSPEKRANGEISFSSETKLAQKSNSASPEIMEYVCKSINVTRTRASSVQKRSHDKQESR
jgi:hypothetical protein